jgi:hypothetical protein
MSNRVYVSGALTNVREEQRQKYEEVELLCEELHLLAYVPHRHTDPVLHYNVSPQEVYRTDYERVIDSNLVISFADPPSLGVGMELMIAAFHHIDVILIYPENVKVSRMARGTPSIISEIQYADWDDGLGQLRELLIRRQAGL